MNYFKVIQRTILLLVNLVIVISLNSQELSGKTFNDMEVSLYFLDDKMLNYRIIYPKKIDLIGEYEISNRYGIPFLTFNDKEWLILYSDLLCALYSSDSKIEFLGVAGSFKRIDMFVPGDSYYASSYLVENEKEYKPDNLMWGGLSKPWVEGVDGYGIGESIEIDWSNKRSSEIQTLIISNGYISYDKPYLYKKNGRIKTVKITNKEKTLEYTAEIADTPNYQFISLPVVTDNVRIEILDVYPGTTWEDTCISYIAGIPSMNNDFLEAKLWGVDNSK